MILYSWAHGTTSIKLLSISLNASAASVELGALLQWFCLYWLEGSLLHDWGQWWWKEKVWEYGIEAVFWDEGGLPLFLGSTSCLGHCPLLFCMLLFPPKSKTHCSGLGPMSIAACCVAKWIKERVKLSWSKCQFSTILMITSKPHLAPQVHCLSELRNSQKNSCYSWLPPSAHVLGYFFFPLTNWLFNKLRLSVLPRFFNINGPRTPSVFQPYHESIFLNIYFLSLPRIANSSSSKSMYSANHLHPTSKKDNLKKCCWVLQI